MLSDARSEVSACFTDVTSITTCTGKFIYNARTEPIRERIFHVKQVLNFKGRENKFDVNRFAKAIDKCAHPMLCYTREPADVRDLKVKFRRLLWLDTCYGSCVVVDRIFMLFSYENRKNNFPINFSSPLLRPTNT